LAQVQSQVSRLNTAVGLPTSMAQCTPLIGRVKNTFLDFQDEGSGDDLVGFSLADTKASSDTTDNRSTSSAISECYMFRDDLKEFEGNEGSGGHEEAEGGRKNKYRPCRKQRNNFRKYVDKLKEQLQQDPEGFNIQKIEHPQWVMRGKGSGQKVANILGNYHAQLSGHPQHANSSFSSRPTLISL